MSGITRVFAAAAWLLAVAAGAGAQEAPRTCSGPVAFGEDNAVRLMRVAAPAPRTHFIEDRSEKKPNCPNAGEACRRRGFLVPGDEVLAGTAPGPFACATYLPAHARQVRGVIAESNGFLPMEALAPVALPAPNAADWVGRWLRSAEAEIEIKPDAGGKIAVSGSATFGALDPGRVARGAVNMGELEGIALPRGGRLALGEGYADPSKPLGDDPSSCRARLKLFGRYLVVEDNGGCGGANVSFTGVYVRAP